MNEEEIEELKDFTIDLTDIDELALGLEVCSKKSNMVIQEFADTIIQLQQENKILKENAENNDKVVDKVNWENMLLKKENKQIKDKLSKIETLIINHNCDTGDIYYKYNSKFLKSELKQRILEILEDKEVSE